MHAGTVASSADGEHQYEPPDECGCCGGTELVPEENWSHLAR
ncbi:hypothetical protein [Salinilacihabitans rarus]